MMVHAALDKQQGRDIEVLDVSALSNVTDFFVIATGNSPPHIKALADEVTRTLKTAGTRCHRKSGTAESQWMAMDYVDVVVHLFSAETRSYYALEELWSDAVRVDVAT